MSGYEFPWDVVLERTRSALNLNLEALTRLRESERRSDGELLLTAQSRLERYVRLAKAWKALAKQRRRNPVADLYLASQLPVSAMALGAEKERARIVAIVEELRACYPADVFPSLTGAMARLTCDNILRAIREATL